jgi:hypothetical protein
LAQFDFWFPDIELPVGFGQVRTAKRLPVMTMVSGYSHWTSAILIPRRESEDLFAGWWHLVGQLGAVPKLLVWDGEGAVGAVAAEGVGADHAVSGVSGCARHEGLRVQTSRPRGQGNDRAVP